MKILIIEDEKPAIENLVEELMQTGEEIQNIWCCSSVAESIKWLNTHLHPDLILMDIQLSDGLSFNILKACNVMCPVIFVTAYDTYLSEAFECNGIDYLLKPIGRQKLKNAISKYKNLQSHFANNHSALLEYLYSHEKKKSRIIVKRGFEFQALKLEDIAYFFTEHKLVFLVDKESRKYLADKNNLSELEEDLDAHSFYRANRKYIINANYIKRFKPLDRSKISLEMVIPTGEDIVVSQENAASFRKWIGDL